MATYVAKGQRKASRDLSLVIKTVLQCAPKLEIRVEIIHIAADELPIGIGYECRRIRRQEGSRLSAVGRDQSRRYLDVVIGEEGRREVPPRRLDRMNIHEGKLGRTSDQAGDGPTHVVLP